MLSYIIYRLQQEIGTLYNNLISLYYMQRKNMDAHGKTHSDKDLDAAFLQEMHTLKHDLDTSSENICSDPGDDASSDESFLGKRDKAKQTGNQSAGGMASGQSGQRKRDIKGNYKAKFNIEKLMIEHEKKKSLLEDLNSKREDFERQLAQLQDTIGTRVPGMETGVIGNQGQPPIPGQPTQKAHWDFLIKEMKWMAEDFERETKKKVGDAKKNVRACRKQLHEKKLKKEREAKDMKHEVKKRAQTTSRMIQQYWKSVEKVVKHNYNVLYEKKRQALRTKRLESFVSKHLKLSVKVAEELNTKSFVEQSMYKEINQNEQGDQELLDGENPSKRRIVQFSDQIEEKEIENVNSQAEAGGSQQMSRALIAEQTVEMAKSFQPTGTDLSSANVKTKVPFLLHGSLREYQIIGLDWLVTLHNKKLNGILADEMGLGKTIQTISMLASLACDKGVWGPHLIVVPTTIIINWEMEFKKWCPAFKILTYFGSQKERKIKRHGWSKDNSFHVCITSYKLVIQDHFAFRRKKWYYMILDEAQNIKNFKSQRWQTLLRFNTKRRLLLTGTPLQNDVMELWSLMHFLMPQIFSSQTDFKEWFSNPFNQSITQNQSLNISVIQKLQSILRPFLLRRLKKDVEKQLPEKVEHIVQCNLSRRQRLLYDEYINSDKTKQTLNDSDFFSIMNVLMQLRKVCNHPDLFEARTIESPFIMQERILYNFPSLIYNSLLQYDPLQDVNMRSLNFVLSDFESMQQSEYQTLQSLYPGRPLVQVISEHKYDIENSNSMQEALLTTRPIADGLAIGKRLPVNCNVMARSNTKTLIKTNLPQVLPYFESNLDHGEIPSYLNTACIPFVQQYYSKDNYDSIRYSTKGKPYSEYDTYLKALKDEEQRRHLIRFAQKLIQWRHNDITNRINLFMRRPVYGEDCRRAVKVPLLLSDVFDARRNKNLDKYQAEDKNAIKDLESAPSAVFNSFALYQLQNIQEPRNLIEDWPDLTQDEIEVIYSQSKSLIREIPMSLQISNKKRKQALKQQLQLKLAQEEAEKRRREEEDKAAREVEEARKREEQANNNNLKNIDPKSVRGITLVLNMDRIVKGLNEDIGEGEVNQNVEIIVDRVQKPDDEVMKEARQESVSFKHNEDDVKMSSGVEENTEFQNPIEVQQTAENNSGENNQVDNQLKSEEQKGSGDGTPPTEDEVKSPSKELYQARHSNQSITYRNCEVLRDFIVTPLQRVAIMEEEIRHYKFIIPKVVARPVDFVPSKIVTKHQKEKAYERFAYQKLMSHRNVHQSLRHSNILFFPHKNLIQYDCGKLQRLATLMKNLHSKGHKVLIFTQMTRILDVLENFLNLHGYTYVRLDGSVKVEMRQRLVDKFNHNKKIFCFISSTRCGGIGINLTGADCVIFYDTDWNPAMDKQAQDRCHRIGQTKTVHIYRLISVNTIEENIFKKSLQKRDFGGMIIEGNFDMEIFMKRGVTLKDILEDDSIFRPKRRDLIKEDNIVFHTNTHNLGDELVITRQGGDNLDSAMDYDKQKELEQYRKRFEEALVRIEDKEDVIALQQARREIDDEFDEEAIAAQGDGGTYKDATVASGGQIQGSEGGAGHSGQADNEEGEMMSDDQEVSNKAVAAELDARSASSLQRDMIAHKSELINWREHPTLNNVTKLAINYFEHHYDFDAYLDDRSKKDNKFVNPLADDLEGTNGKKEEEKQGGGEDEEGQGSDFSIASGGEDDEAAGDMGWERGTAEQLYKQTREVIENKYQVQPPSE